jgi:hypothetical protein
MWFCSAPFGRCRETDRPRGELRQSLFRQEVDEEGEGRGESIRLRRQELAQAVDRLEALPVVGEAGDGGGCHRRVTRSGQPLPEKRDDVRVVRGPVDKLDVDDVRDGRGLPPDVLAGRAVGAARPGVFLGRIAAPGVPCEIERAGLGTGARNCRRAVPAGVKMSLSS